MHAGSSERQGEPSGALASRAAEASAATGSRFVGKQDQTEDSLKIETVGLVRLEDFQRKREELLEDKGRASERDAELRYAYLLTQSEEARGEAQGGPKGTVKIVFLVGRGGRRAVAAPKTYPGR